MKKVLAIYDVLKIQEFIFAPNKLKENIGASLIVQKLFEDKLVQCIQEVTEGNCDVKAWQEENAILRMASSDSRLQAEVISIGGGNAMVTFDTGDRAKEVTKALSCHLIETTGGVLQCAVAYHETDFSNYQQDKAELIVKLKTRKYQHTQSVPLLGIGITRPGNTDGLPSVDFKTSDQDENQQEYLSRATLYKRNIEETQKDEFAKKLLTDEQRRTYTFPRELDKLGQQRGEANEIAVVHIDGNNMGKQLDDLLKSFSDYQAAIPVVRHVSQSIRETYNKVMKSVTGAIIEGLKDKSFLDSFALTSDDKTCLPIRPVVLNGDDVTFICDGRLGIPLAELFLRELEQNSSIMIEGNPLFLSGCAGVAIVKSHFPFYRAYQLAEDLCSSAKKKAKTLAGEKLNIGSWFDFHIVQSGVSINLSKLRQKTYNLPGMEKPETLKFEKSGIVHREYEQYNLLWRPWCVVGDCDQKYRWNDFKKDIFDEFIREEKKHPDEILWKRSRLKRLRNTMIRSEGELEHLLQEFQSRGFLLPKFLEDHELFKTEHQKKLYQTPYFDALEILDLYLEIPQTQGGSE